MICIYEVLFLLTLGQVFRIFSLRAFITLSLKITAAEAEDG